MSGSGLIFRILVAAGAVTAGWFTAPLWQAQPSVRSALRLLFREAAGGGNTTGNGVLTLNGLTFSLKDIGEPATLRTMLDRLRRTAGEVSPLEAERFLMSLMDQVSSLPPSALRSLALALARDRDLVNLLDETTRVLSSRLTSKDLELHVSMELARVVGRDPDRMLLLAEALPPSMTKDEFLSRTLAILALEKPEAVLALLGAPDCSLDVLEQAGVANSALQTLAARSFTEAAQALETITNPQLKSKAMTALIERINDQPEKVLAWVDSLPPEERKDATGYAMSLATPEVALSWLTSHPSPAGGDPAFLEACGRLAKADPAAAVAWLKKIPAMEASRSLSNMLPGAMRDFPISGLLTALPEIAPENQALLLPGAFEYRKRSVEDLAAAGSAVSDPALQAKLGEKWAANRSDDPAKAAAEASSLPAGPLREATMTALSEKWSKSNPKTWLDWLRGASTPDQTAALAKADPKVWADPKNAAFLTVRPAAEQLPWLAGIYHDDAHAAAAVIERASGQGASTAALDSAAKSLAESWQDRDPATARAFALSLPDAAMADSVLMNLAGNSASMEARAAATAAIQDPVSRRTAERAAALRTAGITLPPRGRK